MIKTIRIDNYKSLIDVVLELGQINVFIGANGSGKSNLLEAIAMLTTENSSGIKTKDLLDKGVRVAKPSLTFNSFLGKKINNKIWGRVDFDNNKAIDYSITSDDTDDIYSTWQKTFEYKVPKKRGELELEDLQAIARAIRTNAHENETEEMEASLPHKLLELIYSGLFTKENAYLSEYVIYSLWTNALRGIANDSTVTPLGINGEGLDLLLNTFNEEELAELKEFEKKCISWIDDFFYDEGETYKKRGYKLGRSTSNLYFRDKYMQKKDNNNVLSSENANEGALHLLFYLALFISKKTPPFFAIDNIETGLNPKLCRTLIKNLAELAGRNRKQAIITTHNPAVLDGLNLHDDNQRLFVVSRMDEGHTRIERIRLKPPVEGQEKKMLSELWMRGFLGGLPNNF